MFVRFVSSVGKILLYALLLLIAAAALWYFCFVYNGKHFSNNLTAKMTEYSVGSLSLSWTDNNLPVSYSNGDSDGALSVDALTSTSDVASTLSKTTGMESTLEISVDVVRGTLQGVLASRVMDAEANEKANAESDNVKSIKSVVIVDDGKFTNGAETDGVEASSLNQQKTELCTAPKLFSDDIPLYTAQYELAGKICGMPITFDSTYHKYSLADYEETLSVLPDAMLTALAEKGWSIHITSKPIEDTFSFVEWTRDVDSVAGVCMVLNKEIWFVDDCSPIGLVHEIGHAIDWESGGASLSHEWSEAISSVRKVSEQNASDHLSFDEVTFGCVEDFTVCESVLSRERFFEQYATAFAYYWNSPMSLLEECPELYAYFADRFGVWAGCDTNIEEWQSAMEAAYERGVTRRENPIGVPDINDVGVEENEMKALSDALGDYAEGYDDKSATGKMFAWIRAAEDMAQRYAQSYGA